MLIQPINESSLILFDVSNEEKARIVRQYNRALQNSQGEGTDVAQIFLKPLISQYQKWGDPALIFGLCLAREGQFKRAEGSLAFAIQGVLGTEQYLTIAQEALRMVREDIKNPPPDLPPADIAGKLKNAQMASGTSPAARANFQAPILTKAQKTSEPPQMASSKERRDIRMKSLVVVGVVILSMLLVTLLIIFGIIPLVKQIEAGGNAQDKLEYLHREFYRNRYDPEVSALVSAYESSFGTFSTANMPSDTAKHMIDVEGSSESETTTSETTSSTEPTPYLAGTTTSSQGAQT